MTDLAAIAAWDALDPFVRELAQMLANKRNGGLGDVFMDGRHNPTPTEIRDAQRFVDDHAARLAEALAEAAENNLALAALAETNRKQIHAAEAQVAALVEKLTHWHERYMVDECSPEKCGTAALLSDLAPAAAKHDAEVLARTLTVVETTLVDYGINEPTCGIHAWRCEHPDRYPDYCKCLADLMSALREKLLGAVPDKLEVEGGQE